MDSFGECDVCEFTCMQDEAMSAVLRPKTYYENAERYGRAGATQLDTALLNIVAVLKTERRQSHGRWSVTGYCSSSIGGSTLPRYCSNTWSVN